MKKILLLLLFPFLGFSQVDTAFIDDAYLINLNVYSVQKLMPGEYGRAYRIGNFIYKESDSTLYVYTGYQWQAVPKDAQDIGAIAEAYRDSATGWAKYTYGQYTIGSPLVITAGDTATITINNASTITSQLPLGVDSLWDSANNKIIPENSGDAYLIRIDFITYTNNNNGLANYLLDIGGSQGVILKRLINFPRGTGSGNARDYSTTTMVYALNTFVANGGEIKITSITGTTTIYDINLVITRIHKAR